MTTEADKYERSSRNRGEALRYVYELVRASGPLTEEQAFDALRQRWPDRLARWQSNRLLRLAMARVQAEDSPQNWEPAVHHVYRGERFIEFAPGHVASERHLDAMGVDWVSLGTIVAGIVADLAERRAAE